MQVQSIPIIKIDTTDRLRPVDEGYARLIAEDIGTDGRLGQPVEVRPYEGGWRLIDGGHRLRAAELLGWIEIPAIVHEVGADEARLMEIDRNLIRAELNPLDRAAFLAEREAVYLRLHPETEHGGDRKSKDFEKQRENQVANLAICFSQDVRERTGLSDRTVRRALRIATGLSAEVRRRLAGTALARKQSELEKLAKEGPAAQGAILDLLLAAEPKATSVTDALGQLAGRRQVSDAEEKRARALFKAWNACGEDQQRAFLRSLRSKGIHADIIGRDRPQKG